MNVVSESGLYALIFSSRKPVARAFRRWVTQEVLPAIRKTGHYEREQAPPLPEHSVQGIPITLPGHGRWIVTSRRGRPPHLRDTGFDIMASDMVRTDCQILVHQLKLIEAYWHRVQLNESIGWHDREGFAWQKLRSAILEGGYLAGHYLLTREEIERQQEV